MMKLSPLLAALALASAAEAGLPREMVELQAGQPVQLRSDRAYLLLRNSRPPGAAPVEPVFLRIPEPSEVAQSQAGSNGGVRNVQNVDDGRPFIKGKPESTYLVEVLPGDYVLYGASYGGAMKPALHVCFCLGTVGFSAPAGQITDLGTFLGDSAKDRSALPELREESGFGPSSDVLVALIAGTMKPANNLPVPGLDPARVRPARYHAVGKFFDPRAAGINRLVPIPGVLAYDNGKVVDVQSGKVAEDRH